MQTLLNGFFSRSVDLIVSGRPRHEGDMLRYSQYLQHLYATRPELSESERFEQPYWDYLQVLPRGFLVSKVPLYLSHASPWSW